MQIAADTGANEPPAKAEDAAAHESCRYSSQDRSPRTNVTRRACDRRSLKTTPACVSIFRSVLTIACSYKAHRPSMLRRYEILTGREGRCALYEQAIVSTD